MKIATLAIGVNAVKATLVEGMRLEGRTEEGEAATEIVKGCVVEGVVGRTRGVLDRRHASWGQRLRGGGDAVGSCRCNGSGSPATLVKAAWWRGCGWKHLKNKGITLIARVKAAWWRGCGWKTNPCRTSDDLVRAVERQAKLRGGGDAVGRCWG